MCNESTNGPIVEPNKNSFAAVTLGGSSGGFDNEPNKKSFAAVALGGSSGGFDDTCKAEVRTREPNNTIIMYRLINNLPNKLKSKGRSCLFC